MRNSPIFIFVWLACYTTSVSQQLVLFTDAPTKSSASHIQNGALEGFHVETLKTKDVKQLSILFLFSKEPFYGITYFDYYDTEEKALVIDFHNMQLGSSLIKSIKEAPITKSRVEELQMDLNRYVSGFKPDMRNILRIKFYMAQPEHYQMGMDEFNQCRLKIEWSQKDKNLLSNSYTWIAWTTLISVFSASLLAYGGYITYEYLD